MKFFTRVLTSTALITLISYVLFFCLETAFAIMVTGFIGLAMYELLTMFRKADVPVYRLFGVSMGLVIPAIVYMELGHTQSGEILFLVLGCLFLFLLQFFRKDHSFALIGIALTLFSILYVSWFLSFLIKIRFMHDGVIWIAYLLAVTKSADIGAYLVGSLVGRHSLIPHISPKKTIEGTTAGCLASVAVSLAFRPVLPVPISAEHLLVAGLLMGVVGQIGDLSESLMKRFAGAKDSGGLLPGMGGVLDAVDSVLFTAPLFYFYLKVLL